MIFLNEKIPSICDIENWLWKYNFGTFWRTIIRCRIVLKQFPLSMLILGQKSCILGPTIFKIPQPNWHYSTYCVVNSTPFGIRRVIWGVNGQQHLLCLTLITFRLNDWEKCWVLQIRVCLHSNYNLFFAFTFRWTCGENSEKL